MKSPAEPNPPDPSRSPEEDAALDRAGDAKKKAKRAERFGWSEGDAEIVKDDDEDWEWATDNEEE